MATISNFAQHLKAGPARNSQACEALLNFLIAFCDLDRGLSPAVFDQFYDLALQFAEWQKRKSELGERVAAALESFELLQSLPWSPDQVLHCHTYQLVPLQFPAEHIRVLEKDLDERIQPAHQFEIIERPQDAPIVAIQGENGHLQVEVHTPSVIIHGGAIVLPRPITSLMYNKELDLAESVTQYIKLTSLSWYVFKIHKQTISGRMVDGPLFRPTNKIEGSLSGQPNLFYALKKLERHYVQLETDPFYQELVQILERAIQLLRQNHPEGQAWSMKALERAEGIIHSVFPGDRQLGYLLSRLRAMLFDQPGQSQESIGKKWAQTISESTNLSPSLGMPRAGKPTL